MNFLTTGARLRKTIDRNLKEFMKVHDNEAEAKDFVEQRAWNDLTEDMRYGIKAAMLFKQIAIEEGMIKGDDDNTSAYFITVSPKTDVIDFASFRTVVTKFLQRKCFLEYTASYEQRGVTEDTLGNGFHVHIVARSSMRSKTELLRAALSTFKHCADKQCVDVKWCKNPKTVVQRYLIDYEAKDEHKAKLKPWDDMWREREGLASLYQSHPQVEDEEDECKALV